MGVYTAWDDPAVDATISTHLQRIVTAILAKMTPQSIILRGSFGRSEGSVMIEDGRLRFLSDYEIYVATPSPLYRPLFANLTKQLSAELGVETGVTWVRPDYLSRARIGPFPTGPAEPTISLYESRYGSRILYGKDIVSSAPAIDPEQIGRWSARQLLLNRMAESLDYLPDGEHRSTSDLESYFWVNKTTLACAETLMLFDGQYHYSYGERGRRFASLAGRGLDFLPDGGRQLAELVERATEFKLRPTTDLYPEPVSDLWRQVIPAALDVFRYLTLETKKLVIDDYAKYPKRVLAAELNHPRPWLDSHVWAYRSLDAYKFLRRRRMPRGIILQMSTGRIAYAVVPPVFAGWNMTEDRLPELLSEVRRWLALARRLPPPKASPKDEWNSLRRETFRAWKEFCY